MCPFRDFYLIYPKDEINAFGYDLAMVIVVYL